MNKTVLLPNEEIFESIRTMLEQGLQASFTVTGNSMWPTLVHRRDQVVLEKPTTPLKKGDVVLFCPMPGQYLLHRIHKRRKGVFFTTGDGNCFRDGQYPNEAVIGRVVRIRRKGKDISCRSFCYRLCTRLWCLAYPLRPLIKKIK